MYRIFGDQLSVSGSFFISFFFFPCSVQIKQEVKILIKLFCQILNRFRYSHEVIRHLVTTQKCVPKCNRFQISG